MQYFKFSETATSEPSQDIIENPRSFVKKELGDKNRPLSDDIKFTGFFKINGWAYDLRPYLKRYVYKQYGNWHEIWALNKTNARYLIGGRIQKIVEID